MWERQAIRRCRGEMTTTTEHKPKPRKERKENADRRRRQLLEATLRSVVRHGLSKTTLATVASEAGLSQGVVAFYFKNKGGLLTAALRMLYQQYEQNWKSHLAASAPDPVSQLVALVHADFAPIVCNPDALAVWFSFWGEQKFTPKYAEISADFDLRRSHAIRDICRAILPDAERERVDLVSEWIDTLSDGFWQKLHLVPEAGDTSHAISSTLRLIASVVPEIAEQLAKPGT